MSLFVAVLPLRISTPDQDWAGSIAEWIDQSSLGFSSSDVASELQRLQGLRERSCLTKIDSYEPEMLEDLHGYYNILLEFETHGICRGHRPLQWKSALIPVQIQPSASLAVERSNIIWNIAALEAYQATQQSLSKTKSSWSQAAQHFQRAASWLQHVPPASSIPDKNERFLEFSDTVLECWQTLLIAQAQRCFYESSACAGRPSHLLLGKLAAGCVPLCEEMESILNQDKESSTGVLTKYAPHLANTWADFCRAWGMYMSSKAEYHQAMISKEKKMWGVEVARLDLSFQFANLCSQYCQRTPSNALQPLRQAVDQDLKAIKAKLQQAQHENSKTHQHPVPHEVDLPEIRGENVVHVEQPLTKLLNPMTGDSMFDSIPSSCTLSMRNQNNCCYGDQRQVMQLKTIGGQLVQPSTESRDHEQDFSQGMFSENSQLLQDYSDLFRQKTKRAIQHLTVVSRERTSTITSTLANLNLPHALNAHEQRHRGGGIPQSLWNRVQSVQQSQRIQRLKQDLWQLRDIAEAARRTFDKAKRQLESEFQSDRVFRRENPNFEGQSNERTQETMSSFFEQLSHLERLLTTAQEGDAFLFERLQQLDTNPKFKLLQFQKSQLDGLLPTGNGGQASQRQHYPVDTEPLGRMLEELSTLVQDRELLLQSLKEEADNYDIRSILEQQQQQASPGIDASTLADQAVSRALSTLDDGIIYDLQNNFDKQDALIIKLINENDDFCRAKDHAGSRSTSFLIMMEEAMEEIEQLSQHLSEGKSFYEKMIPKLKSLSQKLGDASAQMTVSRLEYGEKAKRSRQEEADAEMAQRLVGADGSSASGTATTPLRGLLVDDEKVATLVSMGFDTDKVVEALDNHENDVDGALNDLLRG